VSKRLSPRQKAAIEESERVRLYRRMALRAQGFMCFYCWEPLSHIAATADHLIARARRGKTTYDNIRAACARCNNLKGTLHWREFMRLIERADMWDAPEFWLIKAERRLWGATWESCGRIAAYAGVSAPAAVLGVHQI